MRKPKAIDVTLHLRNGESVSAQAVRKRRGWRREALTRYVVNVPVGQEVKSMTIAVMPPMSVVELAVIPPA